MGYLIMTLKEYLLNSGLSMADFARLVPCSHNYPGMIINGKARPSYRMAERIENLTAGLVPRSNWYAPAKEVQYIEVNVDE